MSGTGAPAPSGAPDGPPLARDNPLAFVVAAFAAGVVSRTLVSGMAAAWRLARRDRGA